MAIYTDQLRAWAHAHLRESKVNVRRVYRVYPAEAEGEGIEVVYTNNRSRARTVFLTAQGEILKTRLGWGSPPKTHH